MIKYTIKRLLILIPVIIGISFLIFSIMKFTPGDPARLILGEYATQQDVDALRERMGLNDGFFIQYGRYMLNALKGDFGISYSTNQPIITEIINRFPTTLKLSIGSILIAVCLGIPIGIISAVRQYSLVDDISMLVAMLLTSMPNFWLGLMLMLLFSLKLGLLPAYGIGSFKHFIMPWITLSSASLALFIRMTRSTMLEVIRQDYIRTAKAKGARESRAIFKHAMRNTLLPIITIIGTQLSIQLGGSVVVENVFALPGIGTMAITGIKAKDTPTVMAAVMFIAIVGGLINLFVDILYVYIDPRLKSQFIKVRNL